MADQKKPAYFVDSEDEEMYLDMLQDMDKEEAENLYIETKHEKAGTHLSNTARLLTFEEMSYKNLRYLIIGCERAGAELRVKALAAFIYRASLPTRLAPLVTNARLAEMMHKSLEKHIKTIYKWSNVKYSN